MFKAFTSQEIALKRVCLKQMAHKHETNTFDTHCDTLFKSLD